MGELSRRDVIRNAIDAIADGFFGSFSKDDLRESMLEPRYDEREYAYKTAVYLSSSVVLGYYMGEVYYYDGKVWCRLDMDFLEKAIEKALVRMKAPKGDIRKCMSYLLHQAKIGAKENVLSFSPSVIGFRNGVWDFSDIDSPVFHSWSERMPVRSLLPYDYDPGAGCPTWLSFLSSVLDKRSIELLQKYLGLGCVNRRTMSHKVEETLWLIGGGANGKSTIFDVVSGVFGAENVSSMPLGHLICGSADVRMRNIGSIIGRTFNYCTEVQADDISRYSDAFKSLCSGEKQSIRYLQRNVEDAYDIPYLIFNMNKRPRNTDLDKAMQRRLLFITFRASVDVRDMDRELGKKLEREYSGIRNWMIEGYRKFVADGCNFVHSSDMSDDMVSYYVENGKTLLVFMDRMGYRAYCRVGHLDEVPKYVSRNDLYQRYKNWCERFGYDYDLDNKFGRELTRMGVGRKRTQYGVFYKIYSDEDIDYAIRL
jgi:putative DNA primase/helicase